ncbi:MAG: hypothetical protein WA160_15400 [Pseudobdellovibrio sp.]
MKLNKSGYLIGLGLILISQFTSAAEPVVSIPLKTFIIPTFDLYNEKGDSLNSSDLDLLFRQGADLSKYNPEANKYWQNIKMSSIDTKLSAVMPDAVNAEVNFDNIQGAYREANLYSITVSPKNNSNLRYGLTFGLQIHSSLTKAALLRKVGVYQESPKYYKTIKVKFVTTEVMDTFVKTAFNIEGSREDNPDYLSLEPFQRGIISDVNNKDISLIIHGAYLEKFNAEVPSLFDGLTPVTNDSLGLFAKSRAYRSLVIPFVIADLGESLNFVSSQSAALRGGSVELSFSNSQYFQNLTSEADARWMLRRMAGLTDQDWNEIVEASGYPESLKPLVKAKLMHRFKNMFDLFFDKSEQAQLFKITMPTLDITSADGYVINGSVKIQHIPGYPPNFAGDDRHSPFESGALVKYLKIKVQAAALKVALGKLKDKINEKFNINKTSQEVTGYEFSNSGIHSLGNATVVTSDVGSNSDRIITTGTYYGSSAPIQMVDNVSMTAAVSYQHLLFEKNAIMKNYGANIGYSRDYTYVIPIQSMDEAAKAKWGPLIKADSKLNHIIEPLENGNLTPFLANLKQGEVFTITDSIGVMGRAGISHTIDNLIGFASLGQPSVSFSADVNKSVILRQIQFIKTEIGLQIFIRNGNALAFGLQFDADYFINLLRIRAQTTSTDLHTEAYLIKYNSELMQQFESGKLTNVSDDLQKTIDHQAAISELAKESILALIKHSNVSLIRKNFEYQRLEINHGLKTKELQTKLLWFRSTKMEEEHILTIFKPAMVAPGGGTVNNKAVQIALYSKGTLNGTDPFGFGLELLDASLRKKFAENAPSFSQSSQNPSQMPYGKAYWRLIRSDADISQDRSFALPSVATLEHVWSGWSLPQIKLQEVIKELNDSLKNVNFTNSAVIPENVLLQTKKVDFYKITSHLTLLPSALDVIKNLILSPESDNLPTDKASFVGRLFQKLSELGGKKAKASDKATYNKLMKILGNGDENLGQQVYLNQCQINSQKDYNYTWLNGTGYECLEPWIQELLKLSRRFPKDNSPNFLRAQNRWMTDVLYVLDEKIPLAYLLNELGTKNFIYYIDFAGFRTGAKDGQPDVYTPFVLGEPEKKSDFSNGLISTISSKLNVLPSELNTSRLSAQ